MTNNNNNNSNNNNNNNNNNNKNNNKNNNNAFFIDTDHPETLTASFWFLKAPKVCKKTFWHCRVGS